MSEDWLNSKDEDEETFVEFAKGSVASQNYKILRRMDRIDHRVLALAETVQEIRAASYIPMAMVETFATKFEVKALEQRYLPIERFFWGLVWSVLGSVALIGLAIIFKAGSSWHW